MEESFGMENERKPIRSFLDLDIYQNTYKASLLVIKKIVPLLPKAEQFDLCDQLRRSSKAVPRLIAEGFSKKHQKKGFQKYLDDAIGESNETIVSISHARDLYGHLLDVKLCDELLDVYNRSSKQMFVLSLKWRSFENRLNIHSPIPSLLTRPISMPNDHLP